MNKIYVYGLPYHVYCYTSMYYLRNGVQVCCIPLGS